MSAPLADIVLDGQGYLVVPGSYRRDAVASPALERLRLTAPAQSPAFWRTVGALPAEFQTLGPGPARKDVTLTTSLSTTTPLCSAVWNAQALLVSGAVLYQPVVNSGALTGLNSLRTLAAPVLDATLRNGQWIFAHGTTAAMSTYDLASSTYTTASPNYQARLVCADPCGLIYAPAAASDRARVARWISGTTQVVKTLDSEVLRLVSHLGRCHIATRTTLYAVTTPETDTSGFAVDAVASLPLLTQPDDLAWAVSHQGVLYAWIGKQVMALDRTRVNGTQRFVATGLGGLATSGAVSAGGLLLVFLTESQSGQPQVWATADGARWWLLEHGLSCLAVAPFGGQADDADVVALGGAQTLRAFQLRPRPGKPGLRTGWSVTTLPFDGNARDLPTLWTRCGATLAWPGETAPSGTTTVTLEWSTDGGKTWQGGSQSDTLTPQDAGWTAAVTRSLTPPVAAPALQLRLTVANPASWSPRLLSLWVEGERLAADALRRSWRLAVRLDDPAVRPDGSVEPRTPAQRVAALWQALRRGTPLAFTDLDGSTAWVRLLAMRERHDGPASALGSPTALELTLLELPT